LDAKLAPPMQLGMKPELLVVAAARSNAY